MNQQSAPKLTVLSLGIMTRQHALLKVCLLHFSKPLLLAFHLVGCNDLTQPLEAASAASGFFSFIRHQLV